MEFIKAIIFGVVQGLTEFLPVSSSGHLAILEGIFQKMGLSQVQLQPDLIFEVWLHFGTLVAVVVVFWKDLLQLFQEFFKMLAAISRGKPGLSNPYRRMGVMLIIATLPGGVCGFLFKDSVAAASKSMMFVGCALIFTALVLWVSTKVVGGSQGMKNMTVGSAVVVGIFQVIGLLPGVSRSGMTISGGLFAGLKREYAVRFSFLLSVPIILGATVAGFLDILDGAEISMQPMAMAVGVVVAAIVGYISIKFLLDLVKKAKLHYFSVYCLAAGAFAIILSVI